MTRERIKMKRREAKFVRASPGLSPDQIRAVPRVGEARARPIGKRAAGKTPRAAVASKRS